ncbi:hypothetical protein [Dendronalium sp. ChiSLP03b]|uniref:hypothetical protein n=1 Tax=Dendronalium sp. ChiSLP03b TaxID=3075381 RepID=UPI002AD377BB|nr:hypothetical protein [Dendronalium sp. ChiSLP03b]MDZ8206821.1 hypothetical protein [Dendronalium sp. ChiSLP03b]
MATINISDLRPTGSDLFSDSEGYMNDLGDSEFDGIYGGLTPALVWSAATVAARLSSARCAIAAGAGIAAVGSAISGWFTAGK